MGVEAFWFYLVKSGHPLWDEIISDPKEVANVMNVNFVTVADFIGRPEERATLYLDEEKFIENSINKDSNHPS